MSEPVQPPAQQTTIPANPQEVALLITMHILQEMFKAIKSGQQFGMTGVAGVINVAPPGKPVQNVPDGSLTLTLRIEPHVAQASGILMGRA